MLSKNIPQYLSNKAAKKKKKRMWPIGNKMKKKKTINQGKNKSHFLLWKLSKLNCIFSKSELRKFHVSMRRAIVLFNAATTYFFYYRIKTDLKLFVERNIVKFRRPSLWVRVYYKHSQFGCYNPSKFLTDWI